MYCTSTTGIYRYRVDRDTLTFFFYSPHRPKDLTLKSGLPNMLPSVTWIVSVGQFNKHNIIRQQHNMATLLAETIFTSYNWSHLGHHPVNPSFFLFYRVSKAHYFLIQLSFYVTYCLSPPTLHSQHRTPAQVYLPSVRKIFPSMYRSLQPPRPPNRRLHHSRPTAPVQEIHPQTY